MDHISGEDKGISITEGLKHAGGTMQEHTVGDRVEKVRAAGNEEASVAADMTKDTRLKAAADRADSKREVQYEEGRGDHPAPYTKTPFV